MARETATDDATDAPPAFDYWTAQLRAALDGMDMEYTLTPRHNADDIAVVGVGETRDDRARLINDLELRGFTTTSATADEWVRVDATADPLSHRFDRDVAHPEVSDE